MCIYLCLFQRKNYVWLIHNLMISFLKFPWYFVYRSDLPEDSFKLFLSIILPFILICLFTISIHFFIIIQVNRRLRKLQILRYKSPHQNTDFEESSLMLPKISRQLKKIEACKCRSDSLKRDRRYAQRSTSLPGLDFDIYHDYRINDKNQLHNKTYTW